MSHRKPGKEVTSHKIPQKQELTPKPKIHKSGTEFRLETWVHFLFTFASGSAKGHQRGDAAGALPFQHKHPPQNAEAGVRKPVFCEITSPIAR